MMLVKNQKVLLDITATSHDGKGIGRWDNLVVFVAGAVEGDRVEAHILKVAKSHAFARVHRLVTPSPHRLPVNCPVFPQCGGCTFRHISYQAECDIKWKRVADALKHIGKLDIQPDSLVGMEEIDGYRNKAQYPLEERDGQIKMGFFAPHSHRVIDCRDCRLQPPLFGEVLTAIHQWMTEKRVSSYQEETHTGLLRHIYLRTAATGDLLVCLVINGRSLPHSQSLIELLTRQFPQIKGICLNLNQKRTNVILGSELRTLWGKDTIVDILCDMQFRISLMSFYQVNRTGAEILYTLARDYAGLQEEETVLDLYCGTGTIGLTMAREAKQLIGVEIVPQAIEDAEHNARLNGIQNARFLCDDAAGAAKQLLREGLSPDVVLLDPPRKGCDASLIDTVAEMSPDRVVYISCNPETLARDLALFAEKGYETKRVTPVDLFPRTGHVECVVLMEKRSEG